MRLSLYFHQKQKIKISTEALSEIKRKKNLHFEEFPAVTIQEWETVIEKDLKGKNYKEHLLWRTPEGVEVLPFYRKENLNELPENALSSDWEIIQRIDAPEITDANKAALSALQNGASGLFFDLPSASIQSKADLEVLLKDIRLEFIHLKLSPSLSGSQMVQWLNTFCEECLVKLSDLNVSFSFDPFTESLLSGKLPNRSLIDRKLKQGHSSTFKVCSVNADVIGNAGATIVQQLAFALACGNEYLGVDQNLADKISFNFSVGPNFFLEIAKFRAFRLMWTNILREYKLTSTPISMHAETALWNKSQSDAHNNMLRSTTEAMAAALGGCNSIIVNRFDQHFADSSDFANRIARNIQLILKDEAYLDKVADPGSGSYYIEILTEKISEESWKLFQKIEEKGGLYECIKSGFIQNEIKKSKEKKINAYKDKKEVLVGVNKYQPEKSIRNSTFKTQNNFIPENKFNDAVEIESIDLLNMEAELQKGEA